MDFDPLGDLPLPLPRLRTVGPGLLPLAVLLGGKLLRFLPATAGTGASRFWGAKPAETGIPRTEAIYLQLRMDLPEEADFLPLARFGRLIPLLARSNSAVGKPLALAVSVCAKRCCACDL